MGRNLRWNLVILGGDPWSAPTGWSTLHPALHLNLEDQTPYTLHGGATHISTQVCNAKYFY